MALVKRFLPAFLRQVGVCYLSSAIGPVYIDTRIQQHILRVEVPVLDGARVAVGEHNDQSADSAFKYKRQRAMGGALVGGLSLTGFRSTQ